jgi:hypothetical protein
VTGLNLEGQQARANMVTIDGVDAIDNTINGVRITVPQDAVQEWLQRRAWQIFGRGHQYCLKTRWCPDSR